MNTAAIVALAALVGSSLLLGYVLYRSARHRTLFGLWNSAAGPAGAFTVHRVKNPSSGWFRIKLHGETFAYPLLPGFGAPWGPKATIFFGDVATRKPIAPPPVKNGQDPALPPGLKEPKGGAHPGQAWRMQSDRVMVSPDAAELALIAEDVREKKMAAAAQAVGGSMFGAMPKWVLYAAGGVVLLLLVKGGALGGG